MCGIYFDNLLFGQILNCSDSVSSAIWKTQYSSSVFFWDILVMVMVMIMMKMIAMKKDV